VKKSVTPQLPFSACKVVELGSRMSSGYCGRLLCDYGADVNLVETAGGNELRHYTSRHGTEQAKSGLFGYLHAGKTSVLVDDVGLDTVRGLLSDADILVYGAPDIPNEAEHEFFKSLAQSHEALIAIHLSPYGLSGPYSEFAGCELTATALSGITQRIGAPDRQPLTLPLAQAAYQAGYAAACGAACGLIARLDSSKGQVVEVSETEALATVHAGYSVTRYQRAGIEEKRAGNRMAHLPYPQTVLPCADGFVALNTPEGRQWGRLLELMGSPAWGKDERYRSRVKNSHPPRVDELDEYFKAWLKDYSKEQFYTLCREHEIPSGPVRTVDEVGVDEQLRSRNFFNTIVFPDGNRVMVPGSGCKLSETPARRNLSVPLLGESSGYVASKKPLTTQGVTPSAPVNKGPLQGVRILDMGWVWAGAIPGQILADMGAEVIKVESMKRIDYMRLGRALIEDEPVHEQNPWFHAVNRNKKSIAVNLKSEEGIKLLKQVASQCDGVIENFKPGFLSKISMDYQNLTKDNPGLVMLSMSGVGQSGPLSNIPAYAPFLAGLSGLDSLVGYPEEDILGIQQPYADTNAGVTGAFGLLTALLHQRRTGVGQHVDLAESEAAIAVIGEAFVDYATNAFVTKPQGNDRHGFAPHGHYPVQGDDNWLAIAVKTDAQWADLCHVLEAPELAADATFASPSDRWENRRALDTALSIFTAKQDGLTLCESLQAKDIAAMPLLGPAEILENPHFQERDTFLEIDHPIMGREVLFGPMWRMSLNVHSDWCRAPLLGEHTREVISSLLGMSTAEVDQLIAADILV
tara:strand:- start:8928 stop:11339 length:2412 start_codon:yes stop_codon:yes gene_type:complete